MSYGSQVFNDRRVNSIRLSLDSHSNLLNTLPAASVVAADHEIRRGRVETWSEGRCYRQEGAHWPITRIVISKALDLPSKTIMRRERAGQRECVGHKIKDITCMFLGAGQLGVTGPNCRRNSP